VVFRCHCIRTSLPEANEPVLRLDDPVWGSEIVARCCHEILSAVGTLGLAVEEATGMVSAQGSL